MKRSCDLVSNISRVTVCVATTPPLGKSMKYRTMTACPTHRSASNLHFPFFSIVLGGRSNYRSTVYRKEINWYLGREDYPHLGPGVYHQPSRSFLGKKDAVVYLPGSRRGFHTFLNSGRSKVCLTSVYLRTHSTPAVCLSVCWRAIPERCEQLRNIAVYVTVVLAMSSAGTGMFQRHDLLG